MSKVNHITDKENIMGMFAMLQSLTDIVVGEPDEIDPDKPTLIEICHSVDENGQITIKEFLQFIEFKKTIEGILAEKEVYLRRLGGWKTELGAYKTKPKTD